MGRKDKNLQSAQLLLRFFSQLFDSSEGVLSTFILLEIYISSHEDKILRKSMINVNGNEKYTISNREYCCWDLE